MLNKFTLGVLFMFACSQSLNAKKPNCELFLQINNADSNYFSTIISENKLIFDSRKSDKKDIVFIHIDEPLPCTYIANNDTSKMFIFWIDKGKMKINIDAKNVRQRKC